MGEDTLGKSFTESFRSGRRRSPLVWLSKRERMVRKKERREEEERRQRPNRYIQKSPSSLAPYCSKKATAQLVPFYPCGTLPLVQVDP
jgi:hypothetical protein